MCKQTLKKCNTYGLYNMSNNNELNWTETQNETSTDLTLSVYDFCGAYVGEMALS